MLARSVRQICTATTRSAVRLGAPVELGLFKTSMVLQVPMVNPAVAPPITWTNVVKEREAVKGPVSQITMELDSVMRKRKKKMKKHKLRKRRKREQAEKRKLSQGR